MPKDPADLSRSVEDYLKAIYHLSTSGEAATTSRIAEQLSVAAPSVTGMIKRLAEQGWVEHQPYKGATLTDEGRRAALRIVRRHRLVETYLVQRLGYTWDTVHDEAERLEHVVSDELIARMAAALDDPRFDPHGDPIPTAAGELIDHETVPLSELGVGTVGLIVRVDTESGDRLRWLAGAGLIPGVKLKVVAQQPFSGPLKVRVGKRRAQVLGHDLASQLLCVREES